MGHGARVCPRAEPVEAAARIQAGRQRWPRRVVLPYPVVPCVTLPYPIPARGHALRTMRKMSSSVSPQNGGSPLSRMYSMTPRLQMSASTLYARRSTCARPPAAGPQTRRPAAYAAGAPRAAPHGRAGDRWRFLRPRPGQPGPHPKAGRDMRRAPARLRADVVAGPDHGRQLLTRPPAPHAPASPSAARAGQSARHGQRPAASGAPGQARPGAGSAGARAGRPGARQYALRPKSHSLSTASSPAVVSRKFSGLMSRCITPSWCRWCTTSTIVRK